MVIIIINSLQDNDVNCYLLVDGLASSSASVVHIAHVVAVVGVLKGADRLHSQLSLGDDSNR